MPPATLAPAHKGLQLTAGEGDLVVQRRGVEGSPVAMSHAVRADLHAYSYQLPQILTAEVPRLADALDNHEERGGKTTRE